MMNTHKTMFGVEEEDCSCEIQDNCFRNPGRLSRDKLPEVIALTNAEVERVLHITK